MIHSRFNNTEILFKFKSNMSSIDIQLRPLCIKKNDKDLSVSAHHGLFQVECEGGITILDIS